MVILKNFVRYISAFDYYEGIYWFWANTFENKMLQYFTETSESHIGYFQLWRHILRHLRHLLALSWKSHKPPFRLAQLKSFSHRPTSIEHAELLGNVNESKSWMYVL